MNFDIMTFHYDNVGKLYGPYQADWIEQQGHKVNRFNINTWTSKQHLINNSDSDIFLAWGVDQHTIGDFFGRLKNFNRSKYKVVALFTSEPTYTRFGFYKNDKHNSAIQHDRFIREVKPNLVCYCTKEDFQLSKMKHKLWICNNKYKAIDKVTPWKQKANTVVFAGKYSCWENYQWPSYKGFGRKRQLDDAKKSLGNRLVIHGPNTFGMDDTLPYYNGHRYTLCPRAGHILHPRVSIASQVKCIPIITIPDDCPEMRWFPELKHGHNCFIVKDSQISNISKIISGNENMANNTSEIYKVHNFNESMDRVMNKIKELYNA